MDSTAVNFDPIVTLNDSSCIFSGCTDFISCNYNPIATIDDSSCIFLESPIVDLTQGVWIMEEDENCDSTADYIWYSQYLSNGTVFYSNNLNDLLAANYSVLSSAFWSICDSNIYRDRGSIGTNFYYSGIALNDTIFGFSGIWLNNLGVMDTSYTNQNCLRSFILYAMAAGCTDSTATNYDPIANTDDGSCNYCDLSIIQNDTSICLGDSTILEVAGNASGWQLYYQQDFESIIGSEWNQSSNMTINSSTVLGQFLNDNIQLSLNNLPQHDSIRIVFDFYSMYTWDGHTNNNGPDQFVLDYDGINMMNATFSNISTSFGWSYNLGQSYPDNFTGVNGPTYPAGSE
jgi:hypothetical protein